MSNEEVDAYKRLQQSVPPGEVILTRLYRPFLLDFKRNTVFLVDRVDGSPPPGMPLFRGSEPVARYLTAQSIRYVAYSYGNEPYVQLQRMIPFGSTFFRTTYLQTLDFEDNLAELGRTRRRIYDDGMNFVLDLLQPRSQP